ncbi:hypothetical protein HII17_13650 [Thalassotalea sp. M1531]|uniref:STAS/SEC14 domain-containing protein n=1 Tax=Thalassotalea algicola TaxID=2716224 RepID=A0A7Y0LDU0_9GAMM|nr:hypothetical protein [Thalassotalea algicola]NMP32606.1 hypothetical protein [Thalassotalea algicola]
MVEHGEYKVTVEKDIINVTFIGMFNEVASANVCSIVEDIINEMNGARFCMLFNMLEYEGSTPEAHTVGDKHFEWLEKQNCHGRAIVVSQKALIYIARSEQASLRNSNIENKMFEAVQDARTWLLSLMT